MKIISDGLSVHPLAFLFIPFQNLTVVTRLTRSEGMWNVDEEEGFICEALTPSYRPLFSMSVEMNRGSCASTSLRISWTILEII